MLDEVKKQLIVDLETSQINEREVKRLNSIVGSLEQEMIQTRDKLKDTETLLSQEQAISKSLSKRTEVRNDSCLMSIHRPQTTVRVSPLFNSSQCRQSLTHW